MTNSMLRTINDHGIVYECLAFVCPGCAIMYNNSGLHILPVNTSEKQPSWGFNGNFEAPTLTPSILTGKGSENICHSFLTDGIYNFLPDSTHPLAGQSIPIGKLPDWFLDDND